MSRSLGRPGHHRASRPALPVVHDPGDRWYLPPVGITAPRRGDRPVISGRPAYPDPAGSARAADGSSGCHRPLRDAGGAPYGVVVDLADLDPHGIDAGRIALAADVLRGAVGVFEQRRVVVTTLGGTRTARGTQRGGRALPPRGAAATPGAPDASFVMPSARITPAQAGARVVPGGASLDVVQVAAVRMSGHQQDAISDVLDGRDPAALRLALLRFPFEETAVLSTARIARAEQTVERWRIKVAMWADLRPGVPLDDVLDDARAALRPSLRTAHVVSSLHRLETRADVPSGVKFETFALLDCVLGLDLCHLVGKLLR